MAAPATKARQIPIVCPGHSRPLAELAYSPDTPDGIFLLSGCHAKTPMLRHGLTGDWIGTFMGHKGAVWGVALDDSGLLAATASADFSARLWDAVTGDQVHEFGHNHIVKSVHFKGDRSNLATAGHEGILRIYDVASPSSDPTEITVFPGGEATPKPMRVVTKARWGHNQNTVLTGSADGFLRVFDVRSGERIRKVQMDGPVMDLEMSLDRSIATVAAGQAVHFLNTDDFSEMKRHTMPINFLNEGGASLHPGGDRFIAGGSDLWVRVFDYETGVQMECLKGHHGPVRCLRYAPDGKTYATGSEDGTIRLWQTKPGVAAAATDGAAG